VYGHRGPRALFRRYEILRWVSACPRDWRVLEIGAGSLGLTVDLAQRFAHVTAIDLSDTLEATAATIPEPIRRKIEVITGDFMALEQLETFDLIVLCEVLEHIEDERPFLQKMARLLNPGGHIVISVPAHMKYWSRHDELVGHQRRYSRADLLRVVEILEPDDYQIVSYGFPWVNLLWRVRVWTAGMLLKDFDALSPADRTTKSGQMTWFLKLANYILNPYTVAPLAFISRAFRSRDWSEGYLLFASKKPLAQTDPR